MGHAMDESRIGGIRDRMEGSCNRGTWNDRNEALESPDHWRDRTGRTRNENYKAIGW